MPPKPKEHLQGTWLSHPASQITAIPRKCRILRAQYLVAHPDGGPGTSGVARRHERLRGHKRGSGLSRGRQHAPHARWLACTHCFWHFCLVFLFFWRHPFQKSDVSKGKKKKKERKVSGVRFLDIFSVGLLCLTSAILGEAVKISAWETLSVR